MALFVEQPVDWSVVAPSWVPFDMRGCAQIIGDEIAQVIGIVGRVHDDMLRLCQPLDQPARLRAVAPLTRCDHRSDGQAKRVDGCVDLCRQATFGAANTGSF